MNQILEGNNLDILKTLDDNSVDCVITSPPYWGLRDYGTAEWEGGDPSCDHSTPRSRGADLKDSKQSTSKGSRPNTSTKCSNCGAERIDRQLGLESTPQEYVANMVKVFSEIKRVLKDEGTCWLNLGDTYSSHKDDKSRAQTIAIGTKSERAHVIEKGRSVSRNTKALKAVGLKNKDLVGIPWCVALALQDDGWYLRQDIIWSKPNPMPESVTDRCTKAHEYIFLLTKSPRYYFDSESIKEKTVTRDKTVRDRDTTRLNNTPGRTRMGGLTTNNYEMRNKRSVWTVNTKPFKEAHFAVFPTELIVPMVKAGCPPGGVVLDPFFGSGTTGLVAKRLNRKYIGVELNPEYIKIAEKRLAQEVLL